MRAAMASNLAANALVRQKKVDPETEVPIPERKEAGKHGSYIARQGSGYRVYNPNDAVHGVESEEAE
jgi:hypothetical protein